MRARESTADTLARLLPEGSLRSAPPRLLVVAAHPDDETLGASWLLRHALEARVLHLTDGAPRSPALRSPEAPATREAYARLRQQESVSALGRAGIAPEHLLSFGVVDQEAALALVPLSRRLAGLIEELRPAVLVIHPYEGGHPDHDAAAFAAHTAAALVARAGRRPPRLLEMTSYHRRGGALITGEFLPGPAQPPATTVELSEEDRAVKREMLARYATQAQVLAAFTVEREHYRPAPRYDFTRPPHSETLHYEALGWGLTGARWRELAQGALEEFGFPGGLPCA